ncbi:MAG: PhoU domain-containing protein, partial [Halobacteria archaeon]|nr:PhoU domain-containing protein [Halobacteria archaeon]
DWASDYGIEKGDRLFLSSSGDGAITFSSSDTIRFREVVIDSSEFSPTALERAVVGSYALGRNEIIVKSDEALTDEQTEALYRAERQLIGAGIIKESAEKIVVRCSIKHDEFSVTNLLERLNSTTELMRNEAIESLVREDANTARRAMGREKQANKIFVLILRLVLSAQQNPVLVQQIGLENFLHNIGTRAAAKSLERCADHAEDIAHEAESLLDEGWTADDEINDEVMELLEVTDELSHKALESFNEGDMEKATEIREAMGDVEAMHDEIMNEVFKRDDDPAVMMSFKKVVSSLVQSCEEVIQ